MYWSMSLKPSAAIVNDFNNHDFLSCLWILSPCYIMSSFLWLCAFLLLSCFSPRRCWLLPVWLFSLTVDCVYSVFATSPSKAIFAPLLMIAVKDAKLFLMFSSNRFIPFNLCAFSFNIWQTCLQHAHETKCPLGGTTDKVEMASVAWKGSGRWINGFYLWKKINFFKFDWRCGRYMVSEHFYQCQTKMWHHICLWCA